MGPGPEVRDQHEREDQSADERTDQGDRTSAAAGQRAWRCRRTEAAVGMAAGPRPGMLSRSARARDPSPSPGMYATTSGRWPSTCTAVNTTQTMKLTLWIRSIGSRCARPSKQQDHAADEHGDRGQHDDRRDHPQERFGRTLRPVARVARCSSARTGSRCSPSSAPPGRSAAGRRTGARRSAGASAGS